MLGSQAVAVTEQSLGGEDFSWMLQQVPGALARLGVRTPGQPCPDIHQPTFMVDEACIAVGLKVLADVATSHVRTPRLPNRYRVRARRRPADGLIRLEFGTSPARHEMPRKWRLGRQML